MVEYHKDLLNKHLNRQHDTIQKSCQKANVAYTIFLDLFFFYSSFLNGGKHLPNSI